jgi:hypothetical protein
MGFPVKLARSIRPYKKQQAPCFEGTGRGSKDTSNLLVVRLYCSSGIRIRSLPCPLLLGCRRRIVAGIICLFQPAINRYFDPLVKFSQPAENPKRTKRTGNDVYSGCKKIV